MGAAPSSSWPSKPPPIAGAAFLESTAERWRRAGPLTVRAVRQLSHHPISVARLTRTDAIVALANGSVRRLEGNCSHNFCRTTLLELQACASAGAVSAEAAVVFRLSTADEPLCTGAPGSRCSAPAMGLVRAAGDSDLLVPTGALRGAEDERLGAEGAWDARQPTGLWRGGLFCPRSSCHHPAPPCGGHPFGPPPFNFSARYRCARTALARRAADLARAERGGGRGAPPLLDVGLPPGVTTRGERVTRRLCSAGWSLAVRCVGRDPAFEGLKAGDELWAGADGAAASPVPREAHSRFKYLLHLDGHTYSNRLGWLLFTGSAVLKQTSPWLEWYYDALTAHVHYAPFWSAGTDDVLGALRALRADDARARALGAAALSFARRSLSRAARCAHWNRTLHVYAGLFAPREAAELARWARAAASSPVAVLMQT